MNNESKVWAELDKYAIFEDPAVQLNRFLRVHHISYPGGGQCQMISEASGYLKAAFPTLGLGCLAQH